MSSEKNRLRIMFNSESKIKFRTKEIKKTLEIIGFPEPNNKQNIAIINSFLERIYMMAGEKEETIYKALYFIQENKPTDIAEVYLILTMFSSLEVMKITSMQMTFCLNEETIEKFSKITLKASDAYSNGMFALKRYRTIPSIIKNQNNTLNKMNINTISANNDWLFSQKRKQALWLKKM